MAVAIYYVMRGEEHWIIRFDGRDYGHPTLAAAMKAALAAARTSAENGHEVQVLVQWPDNTWVVSWTSEDDFKAESAAVPTEVPQQPQ